MTERRALRLVGTPAEAQPRKLFCGHCAASPEPGAADRFPSRVCPDCGLGLLLEAAPDMVPTPADPFLVVDAAQCICAVSKEAERLLGVTEPEAVDRHLSEFLDPADVDNPGAYSLAAAIVSAATGAGDPLTIAVRPADVFGVRHWARVGACGPPGAALVLLAAVD